MIGACNYRLQVSAEQTTWALLGLQNNIMCIIATCAVCIWLLSHRKWNHGPQWPVRHILPVIPFPV